VDEHAVAHRVISGRPVEQDEGSYYDAKGQPMSEELWTNVDAYIGSSLELDDPVLHATIAASEAAGLPPIQVSAPQGKFLEMLTSVHGAKRVLEVGTLGGYSTICMARALPDDGYLLTLEVEEKHASVATSNIEHAKLSHIVDVRLGPAIDTLKAIAASQPAPFDLFFIDADKASNPDYFMAAVGLSRPGSLIVVDNVVRDGAVLDADSTDPNIMGTRRLFEVIGAEPSVTATAIQTVGNKGYDGFLLARVHAA